MIMSPGYGVYFYDTGYVVIKVMHVIIHVVIKY